jgi:hypothetical protein
MARLDPQQRAREYRQRHRDDGWTRTKGRSCKQLERKADRAERIASQPDQTSPMEVVDALPDPTSEYLGRSLVERAPGGFRSSVNTAIQLADDSIVWSSMVMEDPPIPVSFAPLRTWPCGTGASLPASISHNSTGQLWCVDQGDSMLYLMGPTGASVLHVDVVATYGSPGGNSIGGIHCMPAVSDFCWWYYGPAVGSGNRLILHNAGGGAPSQFAVGTWISSAGFNGVATNSNGTRIYTTDNQGNEIERFDNTPAHLGSGRAERHLPGRGRQYLGLGLAATLGA